MFECIDISLSSTDNSIETNTNSKDGPTNPHPEYKSKILIHESTIIYHVVDYCLPLTEYCREEFEKFTTFLTPKKCRDWSVFGYNWPIFQVKTVVLVFCYDRYTSAVIG